MDCVYLNGKFTAQQTTGVQRVAARLVLALDSTLVGQQPGQCVLLCPVGGTAPHLERISVRYVGVPGLPLHVWEQFVLPFAAAGGLLVNLAGAAPYFGKRQFCLIHDAAVFDVPTVYTRTFVAWYRFLFRHLARRALKLATVSAFSRDRLGVHLGLDPLKICVVPNGCDHLEGVAPNADVLSLHGLVEKRFLVAVGSANPSKNIAGLVEAYPLLEADASWRLVIVGGGNERVFAKARGVDPEGVVRIGSVTDGALKALYQHAAGLVFPSTYEGFGLPPLEAMSCGCPVAASQAASIPEVCGDAALYFNPSSAHSIATAMRRLMSDPVLCVRLRRAGNARAQRALWSASAEALWDVLQPLRAAKVCV